MAFTVKILSWRFRHLNIVGCLLKRRPIKGGGVTGTPGPPLATLPWYTDEIRHAKRECQKAERRWRLSKLDSDLAAFKIKRNAVNSLLKEARKGSG